MTMFGGCTGSSPRSFTIVPMGTNGNTIINGSSLNLVQAGAHLNIQRRMRFIRYQQTTPLHTVAPVVHEAEVGLRFGVAEVGLRFGVALFGGKAKSLHRLRVVLRHTVARGVDETEVVLRGSVTPLDG